MARPIEQIEQDLTQLRVASSESGIGLTTAYKSYFTPLSRALKQQSIQACYYLCTTCYPEPFLRLNYSQRSHLLKTLQRVIHNVVTDLAVQLETPTKTTQNNDDDDDNEPTGELTATPAIPVDWFANPESLSNWQMQLELEIAHTLKEISYKVNVLLQQAQILPSAIPKSILEADPQADERGSNSIKVPNLLSIFIEQGNSSAKTISALLQRSGYLPEHQDRDLEDEEDEIHPIAGQNSPNDEEEEEDPLKIVKINSLYLRLIEVEFADMAVLSERKNIDRLVKTVKTLRREYRQKQQELIIAEAESAWRNSWFED